MKNKLTLEEKTAFFAGANYWETVSVPRLNIPSLLFSDGPTGLRSVNGEPATVFPVGSAVAATWNLPLIEEMAASLGREVSFQGVNVLLAPMANIHRSPLGGRNFEAYSEDPLLSGKTAAAFIRGLQSEGVGASLKHFVVNNQEFQRLSINAKVRERALREVYLTSFEIAIKEANPWTIMTAYNQVNGSFMSSNDYLLNGVLKTEWAYDGLVMSDWGGTHDTAAASNGLDLEMPGPAVHMGDKLYAAAKDGLIDESRLNDGVDRILRLIERTTSMPKGVALDVENDQYQYAEKVAAEAITLLKNDNKLLPLNKDKLKKIAIVGPNADVVMIQGGGSSHVVPALKQTPFEAITSLLVNEDVSVIYEKGIDNETMPAPADYRLFSQTKDRTKLGLLGTYYDERGEVAVQHSRIEEKHFEKVGFANDLNKLTDGKFLVSIAGYFHPPEDGLYNFSMVNTGDASFEIDGDALMSPDSEQKSELMLADIIPGSVQFASRELKAGTAYPVKLEYRPTDNRFQYLRLGIGVPAPCLDNALAVVEEADAVLLFAGVSSTSDQEGQDRDTMSLDDAQNDFISKILDANSNTAVVLNSGAPIEMPWLDKAGAVLNMWLPGQGGASAVADILFGVISPSGKLPMTFPRKLEDNPSYAHFPGDKTVEYAEGLFVGYRHYDSNDVDPLFPFGHGLSYSSFELTALRAPIEITVLSPEMKVSVLVKNTGDVAAKETVQLYIAPIAPEVDRPAQELKAFQKISLKVGEEQTVTFKLGKRAFAYWDTVTGNWDVDPGQYEIRLGTSSRDIRQIHIVTLT